MVKAAGISEEELRNLTWNPSDGGTYEKVIARLTVDENGVRGDEPGFDKKNVKTHGLGLASSGGDGGHGQIQWAPYAGTTGFTYTNKNPWGDAYHYDDPKLVEMIQWWRGLIAQGYMPSLEEALSGVGLTEQFAAGNHAMIVHGSWVINSYFGQKGLDVGLAPVPVGPSGKRASMFNGLADSVWAGTKKPEAAWQWVKFLGSAECQDLVAEQAVVFPAVVESVDIAKAKFKEKGIDVTPFTVHVDEKTTFPFPITDHASDITAILHPTFDSIVSFKAEPGPALRKANAEINALFK
jgi:multiple sugar transport system substrate-binding protein